MDHSAAFARHFARLIWLLLHEPANVDEQKVSLRALVMVAKEGATELVANDGVLVANGVTVSAAFAGVREVVEQLGAHGLRGLVADPAVAAGHLLGVARILAGAPSPGDPAGAAERQLATLGGAGVKLLARPLPGALPDLELGDMLEVGETVAPRRPRLSSANIPASGGGGGGGGMFDQFAPAQRTPTGTPAELLAELARLTDFERVSDVAEDLVVLAEQAVAEAKPQVVSDILLGLLRRETGATDAEEKRVLAMALRKLNKPPALKLVATQLPWAAARRDDLVAVLVRAGEDGADAVIEQVATVAQQSDRRVYFDALVRLQAGIPTLLHMLGDPRWFVARNAADLLGEMQAAEAEPAIGKLLQHEDDRVRRAATTALMRLGTPRATQALQEALRDGAAPMRMLAASILAGRKDVRTAATLIRALEAEKDDEVQAAFLLALGKVGTPEAVQRLLQTAEAEKGFFRKRSTALRVAAVQGLAEARTAEAVAALKELVSDKDTDVRDAANFALGRVARMGETAVE